MSYLKMSLPTGVIHKIGRRPAWREGQATTRGAAMDSVVTVGQGPDSNRGLLIACYLNQVAARVVEDCSRYPSHVNGFLAEMNP